MKGREREVLFCLVNIELEGVDGVLKVKFSHSQGKPRLVN